MRRRGFFGDLRERHRCLHVVLKRAPPLGQDQQFSDRRIERQLGTCKPNRTKMTLDEISVREVEERRTYLAMHHGLRVAEEILIVRALRGGIREHECSLPAATRSTTTLRVVRRRRRNVAQVDGVERRDVDAELHRR